MANVSTDDKRSGNLITWKRMLVAAALVGVVVLSSILFRHIKDDGSNASIAGKQTDTVVATKEQNDNSPL